MWHLLDPNWLADRLQMEPWQVLAIPIGTVIVLSLLSMAQGQQQTFTYTNGVQVRRRGGALRFVLGFVGGTGVALAITGLWRELVPVLNGLG